MMSQVHTVPKDPWFTSPGNGVLREDRPWCATFVS